MENPISQTPKHKKTPGEIDDSQNFFLYFGSLKLGRDGNSKIEETASQSNNASSSVSVGKNSKKIKNQCDFTQETSGETQWLSENSVSDPRSIWGYQFFLTEGVDSASNALKDCSVDLCKQENFDAVSSNQQPTMESFGCYPSVPNSVIQFERFRPTALYNYENDQVNQTANNGLYYGHNYSTTNNDLSSNSKWNQQEIDTFPKGKPWYHLGFLKEILEGGDYERIEAVILIFQGSYLSLMTDKKMFIVFQKLVDVCRDEQLNIIVAEVLSLSQLFIDAAFCKQGASSIVRLIKKMKKSSYAFSVTKVLSTRFLAMMTHDVARVVIQHCFIYFGHQPNKILYEEAISHFQELAVHKVGCRALNELINTIAGEQRTRLLNHIAHHSAYLSNDPYGNYVVQNVLSLKNRDVSERIVLSLRGEFVELAKKIGGSHVVEKCMESSDYGAVTVVEEILEKPKAPFRLAQDNFGNYVIQKALKKTKEHGLSDLYDSLVESLLPYREALYQTAGGKSVLYLLKDDDRVEWRTSICGKDTAMRWWMLDAKKSMV